MAVPINVRHIEHLIDQGENLKVEFKGERRGAVSDREIYEAVVCLANAVGGTILLGVEDDKRVTGAHPRHGAAIDPDRLGAAIFNNTEPPISTRVSNHELSELVVTVIEVERQTEICATREGKALRRVLNARGAPECLPFYPYQQTSRRGDLGLLDYSAQMISAAAWADLSPLEFERLRQNIRARRGDENLLELSDEEIAKALQLVVSHEDRLIPNVAGLLVLGRRDALQRFIPSHEVAFQVLDARGNVIINEFYREPLLRTLETIEQNFRARNTEQEVQVGMIRLPVPDYAPTAFREALTNAVQHRDYARLGTVYVQMYPDRLMVTNPGGFLEGITLENLLRHEPKPRNSLLTDAFRRMGLVERTGRGIDKIYLGQLQYGRPIPDYDASDRDSVRLVLRGGTTNLAFASFVYEEDRAGRPLSLDDLLVLNHLQHERRTDAAAVGRLTQGGEPYARAVLERLVEGGLIEPRGERRGRVYHMSASLYRRLGLPAGYVRAHGIDSSRHEAIVLEYVEAHGRITRRATAELCGLTEPQAGRLLRRLVQKNRLELVGAGRGAYYRIIPKSHA